MGKVLFVPFPETGHLYATFKIARDLKQLGQEIYYLGIQDFEEPIRLQHFGFISFLDVEAPRDFLKHAAETNTEVFRAILLRAQENGQFRHLLQRLLTTLRKLRPDILVVDLLLPSVALMAKELGSALVLLNTQFYDPWHDPERSSSYEALHDIPELILAPPEFDFPRANTRKHSHYVEASIDQRRTEVGFPWHRLGNDKPLIYCSLGSQSHLIDGSLAFLQTVTDAVSPRRDWQLVLSAGNHAHVKEFTNITSNVFLVPHAPQLDILARTSVMITHGGFNTVKECIFFGVPMIAFPLIRDHPAVTARIVHHGLGLRGNYSSVSAGVLRAMLDEVIGNPLYRIRCLRMAESFRKLEQMGQAARIVLSLMRKATVIAESDDILTQTEWHPGILS